jgi:hypothetical protein
MTIQCWHRPGVLSPSRTRYTCRHCGVLIEECPCVQWRMVDDRCCYCHGSGFVAVVRGWITKIRDLLEAVA